MDAATGWWIAAWALILLGLLGTVLPALPGTILMFAGMWLAAWIDGYARIGTGVLILLAFLTAASFLVDVVSGLVGAKRFGASRAGMLGAVLGALLGVMFAPLGLIFGPLAGAVAGEFISHRDLRRAGRAGFGAWLGQIVGMALKLGIAVGMLGLFLLAYFV